MLSLYTAALDAFEFENQSIKDHIDEKEKHDKNDVDVDAYIDVKVIYCLCNHATCLF